MTAHVYAPPTPRKLTRDEYYRMGEIGLFRDEHVELIDGIVVRMAPIGPPHANLVGLLTELLVLRLAGRAKVRTQQPLVLADRSEPAPDLAIVPLADYSKRHPDHALLVIEVAESSLQYDRETKGPLYAASRVDEYWIVDVVGRAIEVYAKRDGGPFALARRVTPGERVSPAAFADVVIDVANLFA